MDEIKKVKNEFNHAKKSVQSAIIAAWTEKVRNKLENMKNPAALAIEKLNDLQNMTAKELFKKYGLSLCEHAKNKNNSMPKMHSMFSISTNCQLNPVCVARMLQGDSICAACFANDQLDRYLYQNIANAINYRILTEYEIPYKDIPVYNLLTLHIESFGDLANTLQARNYLMIAKKNKYVHIAWWTKNPIYIENAMKKYGIKKPRRLVIVYSSPIINVIDDCRARFPFIDIIFTCFDKSGYNKKTMQTCIEGQKINCGNRQCYKCPVSCYFKQGGAFRNEQVK